MKYLFIVLVLFQNYFAQSLSISLFFDKSTYLEYELCQAVIELRNISLHDVRITQPFATEAYGSGIVVELTDLNNKKIPPHNMEYADIVLTKPIILKPGNSLFTSLPFSAKFGRKRPDGPVTFTESRYPEPGKYKIHVTYTYTENDTRTTIDSKIVELEIIEPTQEDLGVYRELKNAKLNSLSVTNEQKIVNLLQFIKKYPSHIYTLGAYNEVLILAIVFPELHVNTDELCLQMYNNFPTSIMALFAVNPILKNDSKLMESVMSKLSKQGNEKKEMFKRYNEFLDNLKSLN